MKEAFQKALAALTQPHDPVAYRVYDPDLKIQGPTFPNPSPQPSSHGGRMTITCGPNVIDVQLSEARQSQVVDQALILMKTTASRERAAGWQQTMLAAFTLIAGCILLAGIAEGLKNRNYNEP